MMPSIELDVLWLSKLLDLNHLTGSVGEIRRLRTRHVFGALPLKDSGYERKST